MYEGTPREIVMQQTVMSRVGVDRVLEFAFELARTRPRKKTDLGERSPTASRSRCRTGTNESMRWRRSYPPDISVDRFPLDILTAHFVQRPQTLRCGRREQPVRPTS